METVFDVIQSLQLSFAQVTELGALLFIAGYFIGGLRVKKLRNEKHGLEKAVMALNEELLYGTAPAASAKEKEKPAPVIEFKTKNYPSPQIAK